MERVLAHGPGEPEAALPEADRQKLWRFHFWHQALSAEAGAPVALGGGR